MLPASERETFDDGGVSKLEKVGTLAAEALLAAEVVGVLPWAPELVLPHAANNIPTADVMAKVDAYLLIFGIVPVLLFFSWFIFGELSDSSRNVTLCLRLGRVLKNLPGRAILFELTFEEESCIVRDPPGLCQVMGHHNECDRW